MEGGSRLQAVKDELVRLQEELDETVSIRKEAEAVGDPGLVAECTAAEDRLQGLVSELAAEVVRLQRTSGAEALRARLQQLRGSEARARNVLGSGELPPLVGASAQDAELAKQGKPALGTAPPAASVTPVEKKPETRSSAPAASPNSTFGQLDVGFPKESASPTPQSQRIPSAGLLPKLPKDQQAPLGGSEAALAGEGPQRKSQAQSADIAPAAAVKEGGGGAGKVFPNSQDAGFESPTVFGASKPQETAWSQALSHPNTQINKSSDTTSMENHAQSSQASLESFADSGFTLKEATPAKAAPAGDSGFESNAFGPSAFGQPEPEKVPPASDIGFGESAFVLPSPTAGRSPPKQPPKISETRLGVEELQSSATKGAPDVRPAAAGSAGKPSWQAFDAQKQPETSKSGSVSWDLEPPKQKVSGSGDFGSAAFGSGGFAAQVPSRSQTHSPAPSARSARSGNPFQDFAEPSSSGTEAAPPPDVGVSNPFLNSFSGQPVASRVAQGEAVDPFATFAPSRLAPQPPAAGKQSAPGPPPQKPAAPVAGFDSFADPFAPSSLSAAAQSPQPQDDFGSYDPFAPPSLPAAAPQAPASGSFAAASAAPDADPFFLGGFAANQRTAQAGGAPGGAMSQQGFPPTAAGFEHDTHFKHLPKDHFIVTPSMVIPEADWEAAFSTKPAVAPTVAEIPSQQPNQPALDEDGDLGDPSVWVPMTDHDRTRCEQAFESKFGGEAAGGLDLDQAQGLYGRAEISTPLEGVFELADRDGNGRLSYTEFLLFMYLLKVLRRGAELPARLSAKQVSDLLGIKVPAAAQKLAGGRLEPSAVHVETHTPLQTLISWGASEEDAKRALLLNGDDIEAARLWLQERDLINSSAAASPLVSPFAAKLSGTASAQSEADRQPGSLLSGDGGSRLVIKIERAVISYRKPVDRPLFQVMLLDAWGKTVEPEIDTPPCQHDKSAGVFLGGHSVVFSTPVGKMPENSVVYFELKHWKSKEKKWSTLGWTFAHKEAFIRLVDGKPTARQEAQGLNLYEKPLDRESHFRQKAMRKLKPLSSSPDLFLRVSEYAG